MVDGNANFDIALSKTCAISLQVVYKGTDAADDTFKLYGSDNGVDFYAYPGANTITTTITATNITDGWQTEIFKSANLRVVFSKGSSTAGEYQIILTTKEV